MFQKEKNDKLESFIGITQNSEVISLFPAPSGRRQADWQHNRGMDCRWRAGFCKGRTWSQAGLSLAGALKDTQLQMILSNSNRRPTFMVILFKKACHCRSGEFMGRSVTQGNDAKLLDFSGESARSMTRGFGNEEGLSRKPLP